MMNPNEGEQPRAIEPEVMPPEDSQAGSGKAGGDDEAPLSRLEKILWVVVAVVCGVYIFIPEFSDAFPIIGWLDEATAAGIVLLAFQKLRVRIPLLQPVIDWFFTRRQKKAKK